jgi:uncharacterized surface protein with fasciclin (FAS1) repeats
MTEGIGVMSICTRRQAVAAVLGAALVLAGCSRAATDAEVTDETDEAVTTAIGAPKERTYTIIDVASDGEFTVLVAAIEAAGLTARLSGGGPFTVFAPTDAAFAALPDGVLETLLRPGNTRHLKELLRYHVVPGSVLEAGLTAGEITTVQGEKITLATEGGITVNGASIITYDILASNGVIHVIDAVIIPPGMDLSRFS